jgi:hypothetical protein
MLANFLLINWMIRREVSQRVGYPLGDEACDALPDFHALAHQSARSAP